MTLESKLKEILNRDKFYAKSYNEDYTINCFEETEQAVGELRRELRKTTYADVSDSVYEPETDADAFLYLDKILKIIDEVLGFTTEGADKK